MSFTRLGQLSADMQALEEAIFPSSYTSDISSTVAKDGTYSFRHSARERVGIGFSSVSRLRGGGHFYFSGGTSCTPLFLTSRGDNNTIIHGVRLNVSTNEAELYIDGSVVETKSFVDANIVTGDWAHWAITFDGNEGKIRIWNNNRYIFNYTGSFTATTVNGLWSGVTGSPSVDYNYTDNLYADSMVGESLVARPPIKHFVFKSVTGYGDYDDWTPINDSPNWRCIDDSGPHDGDGTYNKASSGSLVDTFEFSGFTMPTPQEQHEVVIRAVLLQCIAKKNNPAQDASVRGVVYDGMNFSYGDDEEGMGPDYQLFWSRFEEEPDGSDWTESDVNNMQYGYQSRGTFA